MATGYVLIDGKRYYVDENGRKTLDNVSQAEADRRGRVRSGCVIINGKRCYADKIPGYLLMDGRRYYVDENGRATLDNVSQAEADRRAGLPGAGGSACRPAQRPDRQSFVTTQAGSGTRRRRGNLPIGAILLIIVILLMIGAGINNRVQTSRSENTIAAYMEEIGKGGA